MQFGLTRDPLSVYWLPPGCTRKRPGAPV